MEGGLKALDESRTKVSLIHKNAVFTFCRKCFHIHVFPLCCYLLYTVLWHDIALICMFHVFKEMM